MLKHLSASQLTVHIPHSVLGFNDTSELLEQADAQVLSTQWIGQPLAQQAAMFGLAMKQPGFHLLVLGEEGSGRTSLMRKAMQNTASARATAPDLVLLHHFDAPEKPLPFYIHTGLGAKLRAEIDSLIRALAKTLPAMLGEPQSEASESKPTPKSLPEAVKHAVLDFLDAQFSTLDKLADEVAIQAQQLKIQFNCIKRDLVENIEVFQSSLEDGLLESFLSRYRVNLLVDNRVAHQDRQSALGAPVIYDDDPSFQSLFGGYEAANESSAGVAEFLRLRAGNLLRAHGGMLMLHLRDILGDQQNGNQILEKLHRVLRNRSVQIEESSGTSSQNSASHFAPEALPVDVKLVLIATRDEYYHLHDDHPEFAQYFSIKVDFSDSVIANTETYQAFAHFIALQTQQHQLPHFDVGAVADLLWVMHRKIDDQQRLSTNFGYLLNLLFESAAVAAVSQHSLVTSGDVQAALAARQIRFQQPEQQLRDSIIDGELMISVHGHAVGQINGLTHIDVGDAYFGSPVRISARCFAGSEGVINIDREVEMTGPNHDKGLYILRSWLSANFAHLSPLSLTASLVFEQEYNGVEGDSASCAELFALLSALSDSALPQGIAVTGALNQHGEVMPIGGINEKIEGFFRLCEKIGLDGKQGVLIPSRNLAHLMLEKQVVRAVEAGLFHVIAIDSVLDGASYLMTKESDALLMSQVANKLEVLRQTHQTNQVAKFG